MVRNHSLGLEVEHLGRAELEDRHLHLLPVMAGQSLSRRSV